MISTPQEEIVSLLIFSAQFSNLDGVKGVKIIDSVGKWLDFFEAQESHCGLVMVAPSD